MTSIDRTRIAFLFCLAIALPWAGASSICAQALVEQEEEKLLEESFSLNPDAILGEMESESSELSRLVNESTISGLEFLYTGDAPASVDQLKAMQEHVAALYEKVEPAVVSIQSQSGQGSGVVVTSDGYILTAAHVISVPNRLAIITFPDGSRAKAQSLGLFREFDAGLLKIYEVFPGFDGEDEEAAEDEGDDEPESKEEGKADSDSEKPEEDAGEESDDSEDSETEKMEDEDTPAEDKGANSKGSEEPEVEEESKEKDSDPKENESDSDEDSDDSETKGQDKDDAETEDDEDKKDAEANDDDAKSNDEIAEDDSKPKSKSEEKPDAQYEALLRRRRRRANRFKVQDDLPSFSYLEIGDSADLVLGQWVLGVGHPGGLDQERGIVLRVGRINEIDTEVKDSYLRTDCLLVGGDSGGPLIGMDGSVIGIHSRIGESLKTNFHVPSNEFVNNWADMLVPVVHDVEADLGLTFRGKTVVIEDVPRMSLARRSGLKVSDRIIRIGDQEVYDKLQFDDAVSNLKPYQIVEFEIQRRGKKQIIDVVIGEKQKDEDE